MISFSLEWELMIDKWNAWTNLIHNLSKQTILRTKKISKHLKNSFVQFIHQNNQHVPSLTNQPKKSSISPKGKLLPKDNTIQCQIYKKFGQIVAKCYFLTESKNNSHNNQQRPLKGPGPRRANVSHINLEHMHQIPLIIPFLDLYFIIHSHNLSLGMIRITILHHYLKHTVATLTTLTDRT